MKLQKELLEKPARFWDERGQDKALQLFHIMSKRVPAYKRFLKRYSVNPAKIKSIDDFKSYVPIIDKDNYLKKYDLEELCLDGKLPRGTFSATSGTTGEPFYFPRGEEQDLIYSITAELYLRSNFKIHERSTLYINGFAMGVWIGGVFTYSAVSMLAKRGKYDLSIISPGLNKSEIIKAIKKLGNKYDQVILGGYPPFVKDVIDEGVIQGLDWQKYNLKGIIFSAESFSEQFRDYVLIKAGLKNPLKSTLNHYGTVDLGTMAHETPLSIMVRRISLDHKALSQLVFPEIDRLPTLAQYDPSMFYFEQINNGLICSSMSGIPLVRYNLKDRGGIISYNTMSELFTECGLNFDQLIKHYKISDTVWKLPFVYVYERSDMVVTLFGANIYPEHIREAHHKDIFGKYLTGKFSMEIRHKRDHTPYLWINSELKRNVKPRNVIGKRLQKEITQVLLERNSEYRNNHLVDPKANIPYIKFWEYESAPYFRPGGKQKWTIKVSKK